MSKTIEQLRAEASQIEEATRQGENTQIRVGGLFQDIIDFIGQIPVTETVLGPLLTALNNSELINPGDGQTLTFSLMKEGWTFSDALTQLQIKLGQISSTVTSNYEAFIQVKDQLQREVDDTDQRVRSYKTEYDQSQIEYATWKSQTDTSISQYAVAIDKVTGDIISISGRVDTAFDQLDFVTNDLEAADKAIGKIFDLAGMNLSDEPSASWLYKNKDGIYGAAATFDAEGNIKNLSKLSVTIDGISTEVSDVKGNMSYITQTVDTISQTVQSYDGRISSIQQTADEISTRVTNAEGNISQIRQDVNRISSAVASDETKITNMQNAINGTEGNPGILARLTANEHTISSYSDAVSYIQQNRDSITATVGYFDSDGKLISTGGLVTTGNFSGLFVEKMGQEGVVTNANMSVYLKKIINSEGVENMISVAEIEADQIQMTGEKFIGWFNEYIDLTADMIRFNFTTATDFTSGGEIVMRIEPNGNLKIKGQLEENCTIGTVQPIRIDEDGNIQRQNPDGSWGNMYAGRCVREVLYTYDTTKTLWNEDDFILSIGDYHKTMVLPSNPSNGKVISIINIAGGVTWVKPNSGQILRLWDTVIRPTDEGKDLNYTDRAELIFYSGAWYWNFMSI